MATLELKRSSPFFFHLMRHAFFFLFTPSRYSLSEPNQFPGRGPEVGADENGIDPTLPSSVYLSRPPRTSARRTGPPKFSVSDQSRNLPSSHTCPSGHTQARLYCTCTPCCTHFHFYLHPKNSSVEFFFSPTGHK